MPIDTLNRTDLPSSEFLPDYIIAIDGSYHQNKVANGFPGSEYGYITISTVLIDAKIVRNFAKQEFIDPKKFRETEKVSSIDTIIPGCNIIVDNEKSAKTSMRKILFEEMKNVAFFEDGETLLETYEALLKIKLDKEGAKQKKPQSPIDGLNEDMIYNFGKFVCPNSGEPLYSTDAMRLHELINLEGTSGEMYGQIMQMFEKLSLIHILRAFEKKGWLSILDRLVFILDGPLACFSAWSWLNKAIITELWRINDLQKMITKKDILLFGIEKTGMFYNHFEAIDTNRDGTKDKFPNQTMLLLSDNYIKKNIIFSESEKPYGQDTYFGRKLFYKTKNGYRIVAVLAFFNKQHQDLEIAMPDQYPRLPDLINVLEEIVCSRYPNSVSPLVSAHSEAAIPLNLGKKIFDQIAKEIRQR